MDVVYSLKLPDPKFELGEKMVVSHSYSHLGKVGTVIHRRYEGISYDPDEPKEEPEEGRWVYICNMEDGAFGDFVDDQIDKLS